MLKIKKRKLIGIGSAAICALALSSWNVAFTANLNPYRTIGEVIDQYNGVKVYYNGGIDHVAGRNSTADGYNLGLKYQCVEFIKRYYYKRFGHKMPYSYGHAKDFFDPALYDGDLNKKRGLIQYRNGSKSKPQAEDIVILGPKFGNPYGHVAIISKVRSLSVEVIQQNPGPFYSSRDVYWLKQKEGRWFFSNKRILGWLRLEKNKDS